ncbi:MAG: glucose-6-phosphate isomerase family protein [Gemmataceae bacterium]
MTDLRRTVGDLTGLFASEAARAALPADTPVYRVQTYGPVPEGTRGGLFYGVTFLQPGLVGDEYFMTRGHFHAAAEAAEFYWCVRGEGVLLLMDRQRRCRAERMRPGSLHYVPGHTAHRTVNTGAEVLCVGACWPADAGHDYAAIAALGFSARVLRVGGQPQVFEVRP